MLMSFPSSKYLTYKHPLWCGCTLQEILMITLMGLSVLSTLFIFILGALGIPLVVGIILVGIFAKPVCKKLVILVGEWKKDKPYGYLMTIFFIKCADHGLMKLPYVRRVGPWRTYRRLKRGN